MKVAFLETVLGVGMDVPFEAACGVEGALGVVTVAVVAEAVDRDGAEWYFSL